MQSKRNDIQLFRALSVALVFLFHAGYGFPNGYLGVDIFFAISGFVIWGLLNRLFKDSERPLRTFYNGRIRRIVPAASTLIIFVSLINVSSSTSQATLRSLIAGMYAVFSFGNIEIARQVADYFAPEATSSPFLHMWSLGIEEQFYLVLPLTIYVLHRSNRTRKRIPLFILFISIFSFCVEILVTLTGNEAAIFGYYSPLPRVWEFGVGILSYLFLGRVISKHYQFLLLLFMILILMWVPAEGIYLLFVKVAILTMVAVLLSSPTELGESFFSRMLVWLGDRSYSFYLWHWPSILAFRNLPWNPALLFIATFLSTVMLAHISYEYIEQPIRRKQRLPQLKSVISIFLLLPTLILFVLYLNLNSQLTFKNSIKSAGIVKGDVGQKDFHEYIYQEFDYCHPSSFLEEIPKYEGRPQCAIKNNNLTPSVLLLGDSHSEHLFLGLANRLNGLNVQYIDTGGLPVGISNTNRKIIRYVNELPSPKVVILSAFWSNRGVPMSLRTEIQGFRKAGAAVLLVSDNPSFSLNPLDCKFAKKENLENLCFEKLPQSSSEIKSEMALTKISQDENIDYVEIRDLFCSTESLCSMIHEDKLLFRDNNHLSIYGSHFVAKRLAPLVKENLRDLKSKTQSSS